MKHTWTRAGNKLESKTKTGTKAQILNSSKTNKRKPSQSFNQQSKMREIIMNKKEELIKDK
jgi:hypothetical protein